MFLTSPEKFELLKNSRWNADYAPEINNVFTTARKIQKTRSIFSEKIQQFFSLIYLQIIIFIQPILEQELTILKDKCTIGVIWFVCCLVLFVDGPLGVWKQGRKVGQVQVVLSCGSRPDSRISTFPFPNPAKAGEISFGTWQRSPTCAQMFPLRGAVVPTLLEGWQWQWQNSQRWA